VKISARKTKNPLQRSKHEIKKRKKKRSMRYHHLTTILAVSCLLLVLLWTVLYTVSPGPPRFESFTAQEIPKLIIQTYHDLSKIPKKVHDNIKDFAPEYRRDVYSDRDCLAFLRKFYGEDAEHTFSSLKGAHKADFFRYCALYMFGGVYLDIKSELILPLKDVFTKKNCLYTVISIVKGTIYQGVIATPPRNPLFLRLIAFMIDIVKHKRNYKYMTFTTDFYTKIKEDTGCTLSTLKEGFLQNVNTGGIDYFLFQEKCTRNSSHCKDGLDRYGYCCNIFRGKKKLMKTRYSDFPWK